VQRRSMFLVLPSAVSVANTYAFSLKEIPFLGRICFVSAVMSYQDRDRSVGIATGYGLDGPGIQCRSG
jgi:hypothetical protein